VPPWVAASSIAVLVTTVPLCWVYRVLQGLPAPLVPAHPRWSVRVNLFLIGGATGSTAFFIRHIYYVDAVPDPAAGALRLAIAALVYILAFVLLIRQYTGLYPEYLVAAGPGGFTVRRRLYANVVRIEERDEAGGYTQVVLFLKNREKLRLSIPGEGVPLLYTLIEKSRPEP
jgi:hypothetical protein